MLHRDKKYLGIINISIGLRGCLMSYYGDSDDFANEDEELEDYEESLKEGSEGCYIATSVYGSYDCPKVRVLRHFRDEYLKMHKPGRAFIKIYYALSPGLVRILGGKKWFNSMFRLILDPFVARLIRKGYRA